MIIRNLIIIYAEELSVDKVVTEIIDDCTGDEFRSVRVLSSSQWKLEHNFMEFHSRSKWTQEIKYIHKRLPRGKNLSLA